MGASHLKTVQLKNGKLQSIGSNAFENATSLRTVKTGSTLREIDGGAFKNCKNLSSITLKHGLLYLSNNECFENVKKIKKIEIPDTVVNYVFNTFQGTGMTITITEKSSAYYELMSYKVNNKKYWKKLKWTLKIKKSGRTAIKTKKTKISKGKGKANTKWYKKGKKTLYIKTADDLAGLAKLVNEGNSFTGKKVILKNDIDLAAYKEWTCIGYRTTKKKGVFNGTFDGKNHKIYNLRVTKIKWKSDFGNEGLFGAAGKKSNIKNLILKNVYLVGTSCIGGVVCWSEGQVQNCKVYGRIEGNEYVGGIAGGVKIVKNCVNHAELYGVSNVDGIAGSVEMEAFGGKMSGCKNKGKLHSVVSYSK
jgi:hypothetical protein